MKKSTLKRCAALGFAAMLTGCFPARYTTLAELTPTAEVKEAMTLEQASAIIKDMIQHPAAGRNTRYPDDRTLGKYTTSIRLRKHNRTGLVLIEVFENKRAVLEIYAHNQAEGEKFAAAVWRLRQEYRDK